MTPNERHPSMLELDLHFATQAGGGRVEGHVARCEVCRAYLAELEALQADAPAPPARRRALQAPTQRSRSRASGLTLTLAAGLAVLGAVAALLVTSGEVEAPAVAVKGSPAVQLLVRRGGETRLWDRTSPVRPGDALGLRVACEGFSHVAVAVASREGQGRWAHLSWSECPATGAALPFTLVVDDEPGRERFAVVFGMSVLDARALDRAIERRRLDSEVWVTRFELSKEAAR